MIAVPSTVCKVIGMTMLEYNNQFLQGQLCNPYLTYSKSS